jgi:hypothetical protein
LEEKATWTVDVAKELLVLVGDIFESPSVSYVKSFIAIKVSGNNYFAFHKRSANKSLLGMRISEELIDEVSKLLDEQSISFTKKRDRIRFTVNKDFIKKHADLLRKIAEFVKETWKR